ncbi:MAG: hypothetical protein COZ12_01460 [Deltaproteobacteria bacterium CG_4_10_14_3_um_filter_60_8]|nr:MAG: hypothetical protein AUK28_02480 [Desulfobacterales bacterium CG2_30_60_27]PIY24014.1 MAG: hypothetical protein COZ12_01460 [Deltaproteobacteria bacterium CG_4_10_14_3_um_filter_60_8]
MAKEHDNAAIHVCLVSKEPVPNLVPLLMEKPAQAVFLVTPEMADQAKWLEEIVGPHGIKVQCEEMPGFDFDKVAGICEQLIHMNRDAELTLNVTGGTKVAALAAFTSFYSAGKRVIYLNTKDGEILQLTPEARSTPVQELLQVKECLLGYGLRMTDRGEPPAGFQKRRKLVKELAPLLCGDDAMRRQLNAKAEPFNNSHGKPHPPYLNLEPGVFGEKCDRIFQAMRDAGLATGGIQGSVNVNSKEGWFFLGGGWLEEFVFATVQERPVTDARMNVKLDWERNQTAPKRAEQQIRNEFDVLFTSGNRLHVISCKTGNLDAPTEAGGNKGKEAIYELEALADKAGGPFGRAMLVSARRLSDYSRSRASRMKIEVVDGVDVLGLGKRLERWRQGA